MGRKEILGSGNQIKSLPPTTCVVLGKLPLSLSFLSCKMGLTILEDGTGHLLQVL